MKTEEFKNYLEEIEKLKPSTVDDNVKNIVRFGVWATEQNFADITHINYTEILLYVQQLKTQALSTSTINIRLNSIRKYYEYLKHIDLIDKNPAKKIFIKGAVKKIIHNPLTYTELEALYNEFAKPREHRESKHKAAHERNTIIVGLMIWQGLHSGELDKIKMNDVNLNEGQIYIPGTARSNGRKLKLESKQIITLHKYITETKFDTEKLFPCHPHNTMQHIAGQLKGINQVVKNAGHIRASVILHWLRVYDKRTVQYMLGHRWISSTEHYEVQELTGLTDLLKQHHPFS